MSDEILSITKVDIMIYFLIRVIVNSLAVALVMNIVPGLRLAPTIAEPLTTISAYVGIGLIFGILRSFLRPTILFLTGRLYIWSMGLSALATDTFIFVLLSYIAPAVWQIGEARLFSAMVGAMTMGLVVIVLEALTGLDSPHVLKGRRSPFYWRWLGMLPTGRRNRIVENLRTQQMVNTIRRYVVDILVGISPIGGLRRSIQRVMFRRRPSLISEPPAAKLRLMLQELGPTFIKFGQMVGSRSEILPVEWRTELEKLQDAASPFLYREVEQDVRREFGKPIEDVFASFEQTPLAAASTAQVHAARLFSGNDVVVKVRRPNIEVTVKGDLNVMQDVLEVIEHRIRWSRRFGISKLFHEFAENVITELDFTNEAYNASLLRHNMQPFPFVHIPLIYDTFSTTKVLTQERVVGVKISDVTALDAAGLNREELGIKFFRALLHQVFFDGFFHADPHPGNIWIELETGRVIFIDMGLMGYLSLQDRFAMGELIWALHDHDANSVTRVVTKICEATTGFDTVALKRDIERLINRNLVFATAPSSLTTMMTDLINLLVRHGLHLRKEFILAVKAIGQGESIMRTLMGDKPIEYILNVTYTLLMELIRTQLTVENFLTGIGKPLSREFLGRFIALQSSVTTLLDEFQNGKLAFQLNKNDLDQRVGHFRKTLDSGIRRIIISILLIGLLLGSTLILSMPMESINSDFERIVIRIAAEIGFVFGAVFSIVMLLFYLWKSLVKE